ncbi:MAG TPA: type II secretion system protein GspG [Candidatus Dormibacteraeota bacterium]|nr:type II secretion system protein GspG [Candidatus Dormibacteraeota bacterium]
MQNGPSYILFRLGVALVSGLLVAAVSIFVAWQNARGDFRICPEQYVTEIKLRNLRDCVEAYRQRTGYPPGSLPELTNGDGSELLPGEFLEDGWRHRFRYELSTNYLIISYGRDDKPGGTGFDCDLTSRNLRPAARAVTFGQFISYQPARAMHSTCAGAGLLTACLALVVVRKPVFSLSGMITISFRLGATALGAIIVAVILAGLHYPVKTH